MQPVYEEITEYKWRELKYNHSIHNRPEEPVKKRDHTMDNLKYLVHAVDYRATKKKKRKDVYKMNYHPGGDQAWMGV